MQLDEITRELDMFFGMEEFPPDPQFRSLVPEVFGKTGVRLENYLTGAFLEKFNGLMICNSQKVGIVYCIVFLSEGVLDKVFARGEREALLITHHPLVMETSGRGFLPLPEDYLAEMQKRAISVYAVHVPLDVHDKVSKSRALARELELSALREYCQNPVGYSGVYGYLPSPVDFERLLARVSDVTGVPDLHFIKNREVAHQLGIIPGGTNVEGIMETSSLGCDTLLTGMYYNQVQSEIGEQYREAFNQIRDSLDINLIECSHYASEAVVMRTDMVDLCTDRFGVNCEFIPQDDPWY